MYLLPTHSTATNLPKGKNEMSQFSGYPDKDQTIQSEMLSKCSTQIENRALSLNPSSNLSISENILASNSCPKNILQTQASNVDDGEISGEDESLNENKEEIETLTLKNNMTCGVLTAGRNVYFNNKIKQFNVEKNMQPYSTRATKESYRSLFDQSQQLNKGLLTTSRMEKVGTGLILSPSSHKVSPQPKRSSFNELDDMFDEMFSDDGENEEKGDYDDLEETQKIIPGEIKETILVKEKVFKMRSNKKSGTTIVGVIRANDEEEDDTGIVGGNVLEGLQDEENEYISAEKQRKKRAPTFEDMVWKLLE